MSFKNTDIMLQCFRLKLAQRARQIANTANYDKHMKKLSFINMEYAADLLDLINVAMKTVGPEEYLDDCIKRLAIDTKGDDFKEENDE